MKHLLLLLFTLPLAAGEAILDLPLDANMIHKIPVAIDVGTTSLMFPVSVDAIRGNKTATASAPGAAFQISHTAGSNVATLRALSKSAKDVLTVIISNQAYLFQLEASDKPNYLVRLYQDDEASRKAVSPEKILSLIDKSKAYQAFQRSHPEVLEGVAYNAPNSHTLYSNFICTLKEVFRFNPEDTVIFRCELRSTGKDTVFYNPQDLAVRVGDRIYSQSVADASGVIPAGSKSEIWFAITGTPQGGRNELSVNNEWSILVVRTQSDSLAPIHGELPSNEPAPFITEEFPAK